MIIHPKVREQGKQAFLKNIPEESNPYQHAPGQVGIAQQAAWSAGWIEESLKMKGRII